MSNTSNSIPDLDFIIAGGAEIGLGHVMRSAALASAAARRGWPVRAFIDGDRSAANCWQAASGQQDISSWSDWNPHASARITLLDHPREKSHWLGKARHSRTATVVLDDMRYPREADLTICPALHHFSPKGAKDTELRILQGPRYAILGEAHRETSRRALGTRTKLLLSMGGADPHRVTPRIAPLLRSVVMDSEVLHGIESCHVVLGPAYLDSEGRTAESLTEAGWRVHRALDSAGMAKLMSESRLAVMGFGTSLTELAWHGTPHLSVTHHQADDVASGSLQAQGIGIHLGYAAQLDERAINARFRQALEDRAWQHESSQTALRVLEGGTGVERILDRLALLARSYSVSLPSTRNNASTTCS